MSSAAGGAATPTIVCVDDDALVLRTLREQLQRGLATAVHIETADSGAEALALLDELAAEGAPVPLLISDQSMPGMDGSDFLARVHERWPQVLKVMLSGAADARAVGEAVNRAGLYRILHKPWNEDDLVITVREALRSVAQQQALARTHDDLQHSLQQMRHQALHDALTGLPNRAQFDSALAQALATARQAGHRAAVLFLDLDRFKRINDTLGHPAGDELLRNVVSRLQGCVRERDLIARWGGDEFTVLLPRLQALEEAHAVARRVMSALAEPMNLAGNVVHVSASVGISVFPEDAEDAEALVKNADAALYRVKAEGRNGWQAYSECWRKEDGTRLALESALHHAVQHGELKLHYQPMVDARSGRVTHLEALARWQHPSYGWVPPLTFIPLAEESGLILELGDWVLREACMQLRRWHDQGHEDLVVSVNVSAMQFERGDVLASVRHALAAAHLPGARLELEITEATGLRDLEGTARVLREIAALGVRIALDDFGTGFAPLSHVKLLPCHVLKIDRSFVSGLLHAREDRAIVAAVLALGRGLDLTVVAEGVEDAATAERLKTMGCERLQGYHFARPAPAGELRLGVEAAALQAG